MDLITILRALWQRRALVAIAAALSVVAGIVAAYHVSLPANLTSRQYTVAVGQARFLIDTPASQVLTVAPATATDPAGAGDLASRANLLANLIPSSPVKAAIAKRAGIRAADLTIVGPPSSDTTGATPGPSPLEATQAANANDRTANIVTITVPGTPNSPLPVISVQTQSPREETAARLANATIAGLQDFLASVPDTQRIPNARKIVLRPLGTAQVGTTVHGPPKLYALLLPLVLFTLACAAIVFVPHVIRAWREVAAPERETTTGDEEHWTDEGIRDLKPDDAPERVPG
jgi:capsular polysaccharide biosynthesis protein